MTYDDWKLRSPDQEESDGPARTPKCPRCGTWIAGAPADPENPGDAAFMCASCEDECDALDADEDADWNDGCLDDPDENEDGRCVDPVNCTNPHPFHSSSECETVEMYEEYERGLDEQENIGSIPESNRNPGRR